MASQELFTVSLEANPLECWDDEGTASALGTLAVRLHSTGISLRETAAALEQFGVTRPHQAVGQWVHRTADHAPDPPTAKPSRVAVNETAVIFGTEQHWLNAAINIETKLLLGRSSQNGAAPIPPPSFSAGWPRNTTSPRRRSSSTE